VEQRTLVDTFGNDDIDLLLTHYKTLLEHLDVDVKEKSIEYAFSGCGIRPTAQVTQGPLLGLRDPPPQSIPSLLLFQATTWPR
jgi:hypothetical protein